MLIMYGIKNCDTIKKARNFLDEKSIDYKFHDFKKDALDETTLQGWVDELGWEVLVSKRGTTWRKLPDEVREGVVDSDSAVSLMLENLSLIKRPVLKTKNRHIVGFDAAVYSDLV